MNDDRTLERTARSWLEEGPTQAPDRAVEAALTRIQTIPQVRDLALSWGIPARLFRRPAITVVAAVLLLAVGGFEVARNLGVGTGGPSPTAVPSPTESVLLPPRISTNDVGTTFRAGTYQLPEFATPFRLTLTGAWVLQEFTPNNISLRSGDSFIALIVMNGIYPDPCHAEPPVTPIAPGVDALVNALGSMRGFEVTGIDDVSVGGAPGKSFTLTNSIDPARDGCTTTNAVWIGTYSNGGVNTHVVEGAPGTDQLWAVDVGGMTVLMGGPAAVVASIDFGSTP